MNTSVTSAQEEVIGVCLMESAGLYIGVKIVGAVPATDIEASMQLSRPVTQPLTGADGYIVEYEDGYQSWSPKPAFDKAYRRTTGMSFGLALEALKQGKAVTYAGWKDKGMWLSLSCSGTREVPAENFWSPHNAEYAKENGGTATVLPSITMKTATGEIVMGWTPSQLEMLTDGWMIAK